MKPSSAKLGTRIALALAIAWAGSIACGAPAKGLVGHWSFDKAKGHLIPDLSGHANHARVRSGVLVKGVRNAGLLFDGRSTSARCMPSPSLSPTRAITIEAWVNLSSGQFSGFPAIVRQNGAFALRFSDTRLGFLLWIDGKVAAVSSARAEWKAGVWTHVAATYDGAQMRLFLDGAEDANSPKPQSGLIGESPVGVGIGSVRGQYLLNGILDEVRIYNRALSPAELEASHAAGLASLRAQASLVVKPTKVGDVAATFRKPKRDITMVKDGFLWIDAEDFADYGGWWLDTQFTHLMGSAYLIAAGVGTPVTDATVDVTIPKAGTYRLWVRARNWIKEHSPGKFKVIVGGTGTEKVFGAADSDAWIWESGGEFKLAKGKARIALRDLTGYYGRCDALVLTTDMAYTPPAKVADITQERSRLTGLSLEPRVVDGFDVIVVGAGAAGSCATLAAARMGAKTALIQNRPVLGGNASIECGVPINGAASCHPNARESGIIEECGRIKARFGYVKMSEPFRQVAEKEKNLTVFLNNHVFAAQMAGKSTIASVKALNTLTNEITIYKAKVFLDCTGDGWLGHFASADYRLGRESRDQHDESLAPEKPDKITMSGCLMGNALSFRAGNMGKPVAYAPPPWAARLPKGEALGRKPRHFAGGQWWLEHKGTIDDIYNAEQARDELIRISFGYWNWIKNESPFQKQAANYAIFRVPLMDAKRESRRLVGDYILTQNDVQGARVFPDRISYGGWPLDVHHPLGIYSGNEGPFHTNAHAPIYTIPFRCLYSKNIDNLLFAGRCMSVTHIALGSVRVQGTLSAMGQAAGTAAAMCCKLRTTPRGIYKNHITQLQQTLLKHDQYIPGIANEDADDLARKAKAAASSTARYEFFGREDVQRDDSHPLNMARAVMFPRSKAGSPKSVFALLVSKLDEPTEVTLHVRGAKAFGDFSTTEDIATATVAVPPEKATWVEVKVDREIAAPFVYVWASPAEGIEWRMMSKAPMGCCRAYGGGPWKTIKGQYYAFCTDPPLATEIDCKPESVVNGVARIVGEVANAWVSDPTKPMPQWVQLDFGKPTKLNTVYLTFDTDMNTKFHTIPIVRQCVRDYELSYHDGAKWTTLATVRGNFQRRRVHRLGTVAATKLRLTVHATNGDKAARVFEIRAYHE